MNSKSTHILHVFSTFAVGGAEVRTATLVNALGGEFRHTILSINGQRQAVSHVREPIPCLDPPTSTNPLKRPLQLRQLLRRERPDLVITYNWGAIEAVMAARSLFMPVIHTEDGFGPEEAVQLLARRVWTRRILLRGCLWTVVPSRTLEKIALEEYRLARNRVQYIPNGIDLNRFHPGRDLELRTSLGFSSKAIVFGTIGALRPEKNLPFLLQAFRKAAIPNSRLVLVGEGEGRKDLECLAGELGIAGQVHFAGARKNTANYYRAFDIFVMSSVTEQMPLALLEAMGSGLPAICTDAGDTAMLLSAEKGPEILRQGDLGGYTQAMCILAGSAGLRKKFGEKNRARCEAEYGMKKMVDRYRELYRAALK
jgi:glycosyltransferase involved in cell wall biosynthesis